MSSVAVSSSGGSARWAEGKIALVTGATRGIGFSIAERLGLSGAHVVICSRSQKNVDDAVRALQNQGIKVTGLAIHVGTAAARSQLVQATVAIAGKIDILVSNVAVNPVFGPMLQSTSESAWDKIFDVNVKSHFFLVKECLPYMKEGSNILIVSSYAGYTPNPFLGAYSVSKTALLALTKVMATELAGKGIRVNCVAPGIIKTKFSEKLWNNEDDGSSTLSSIPMQRFGQPHEVGALACFLCSDDASYITGETVVVAGGVQSRL